MKTTRFRHIMSWDLLPDVVIAFAILLFALSLKATAANQGADSG